MILLHLSLRTSLSWPLPQWRQPPFTKAFFHIIRYAPSLSLLNHMTYDKYRKRFQKVIDRLKLKHRPHETRHTFITKAKACNMDEYILKLIIGHSIEDITEKVYTHRTMKQLRNEIKKIRK